MFTTGQKYFALIFIITFAIGMYLAYKKDKKHQKMYYKNVWKVGLIVIILIAIFATLTFWINE
jgi:cell shape-determining protein MreD